VSEMIFVSKEEAKRKKGEEDQRRE